MRKVLEDLILDTSIRETYTIYGKKWTLKTLSSEEQLDATASTKNYDNVSRIQAVKTAILARAVVEYEGIELNKTDENIEFLGKFPSVVIESLYINQLELQKKLDDSFKDLDK